MASTTPKSPLWRKPSDILKFRQMKSKKRILQKRFGIDETDTNSDNIDFLPTVSKQHPGVNPFRCSPRKKMRHNSCTSSPDDFSDISCDATLFELLQGSHKVNDSPKKDFSEDLKRILANKSEDASETPSLSSNGVPLYSYLPFDWSLKTAFRITSFQPFPWSGRLTTPEESSGVTGFVRCLPLSGNVQHHALDTSSNAQLYQCCQLWVHPSLPWLNLFPRNQNKKMAAKAIPLDPKIHQALQTDWTESFRSLFNLLRARQCPYFYLCTHGFSVLFRAAGIGRNPHIHALLTPTTRGFRAALEEDGIEFTMPLANGSGKSEDSQLELSSDEAGNASQNELIEDDDEMLSWLKSVGVGGDMLAHLDMDKHRIKKGENMVDYRPQSLIYMEDSNVHALFNYLLNSKSCVPLMGPLAGIPPTLLSPVAFTGATLRPLKMRHCQAQQESQTIHMLDISGPILPHMMHYLNRLITMRLRNAQFDMKFSTLTDTAPFSEFQSLLTEEAPSVFGQQSLSDCGLLREILQEMCSHRQGTVLQEVHAKDGQYSWS